MAAAEERSQVEAKILESDALVTSFLVMFKRIEAECEGRGKPCYIIMENPYSTRARALWNRWEPFHASLDIILYVGQTVAYTQNSPSTCSATSTLLAVFLLPTCHVVS